MGLVTSTLLAHADEFIELLVIAAVHESDCGTLSDAYTHRISWRRTSKNISRLLRTPRVQRKIDTNDPTRT